MTTMHAVMHARTLALAALVIVAAVHGTTAQVTGGCAGGGPSATAANGFFTSNGVCFAVISTATDLGRDLKCGPTCTAGGLGCVSTASRTAAECGPILSAFTNSEAAPADMPASPGTGSSGFCLIHRESASDPYRQNSNSLGFPLNSIRGCEQGSSYGPVGSTTMMACECAVPDTTAPTLSGVSAAQATSSSVTVSGTTDEAATVYCTVTAASTPTAADVKSSGQSTSAASAGSFTVTATGVSGDGSKTAYCVGEDSAGNLGGTPATSSSFDFGASLAAPTAVLAFGLTVLDGT